MRPKARRLARAQSPLRLLKGDDGSFAEPEHHEDGCAVGEAHHADQLRSTVAARFDAPNDDREKCIPVPGDSPELEVRSVHLASKRRVHGAKDRPTTPLDGS